jgi:hypothetical protein
MMICMSDTRSFRLVALIDIILYVSLCARVKCLVFFFCCLIGMLLVRPHVK